MQRDAGITVVPVTLLILALDTTGNNSTETASAAQGEKAPLGLRGILRSGCGCSATGISRDFRRG